MLVARASSFVVALCNMLVARASSLVVAFCNILDARYAIPDARCSLNVVHCRPSDTRDWFRRRVRA